MGPSVSAMVTSSLIGSPAAEPPCSSVRRDQNVAKRIQWDYVTPKSRPILIQVLGSKPDS